MTVTDLIRNEKDKTAFSFEVLPPVKGTGIDKLFSSIDSLCEFNPRYINITTHRNEVIYKETADGLFERRTGCRRPGTVAIADPISNQSDTTAVLYILCSSLSHQSPHTNLLDLQFLGITNLLLLRGDKAKDQSGFVPEKGGCRNALELAEQVNAFNNGFFADGSQIKSSLTPFVYGVAGYPEKHEESPNQDMDIYWLKKKVEAGAEYVVTQMFYDNNKYFDFVERARKEGINVPIIPGIKPFSKLSQLSVIPKTFKVDLPQELVTEVLKCNDDRDVKALGIEWCINQCRELIDNGVPGVHFYTIGAVDNVRDVARAIY